MNSSSSDTSSFRGRANHNSGLTPFSAALGVHLFLLVWFAQLFTGVPGVPLPGTQPLDLSPQEAREYAERVQQSLQAENYHQALDAARILHQVYPANPDYIQYLAQINEKLGRHSRAIHYWELFMNRAPDPQRACPKLGKLYEAQGQFQKAIQAHERCLDLNPSNTDLILYLALAHEHAGHYDRAVSLYKRGLEIAPHYQDHRLGLARIAFHENRLEEALNHVEQVLAATSKYPSALTLAGKIHEKMGHPSRAANYYERANERGEGTLVSPEKIRHLNQEDS